MNSFIFYLMASLFICLSVARTPIHASEVPNRGKTTVTTAETLQESSAIIDGNEDEDDDDDDDDDSDEIDDPFEFVNRLTFGINQSFDALLLRPLAVGYQGIFPQGARNSVSNFIENVGEPLSFLNNFFQQNATAMGTNVKRLFLNTFMGFFGLFDVASEVGIKPKKQRFMDTLSKAELGAGPYFVLPLLGPSNLRDAIGLSVDWAFDPFGWGLADKSQGHVYAWVGLRIVDARSKLMRLIDSMNHSKDPYIRYRFMYSEFRRSANADTSAYASPVPDSAAKIVFTDATVANAPSPKTP